MNRRLIGALSALPIALVGIVVLATPSQATPQVETECKTVTHRSGDAFYATGAGTSEATNDGLYLSIPSTDTTAKAGWKVPVDNASLASFEALRYDTKQITGGPDARTVAAIKLTLSPSGKSAVMEPMYGTGQAVVNGAWQSWNAQSADRLWWVSGAPDNYLTWTALKAAYPDEKVTAVRIEQGSWNHGTESLIRNLKVDIAGKDCRKHNWKEPNLRVKPSVEFQTLCVGIDVKINPGDTRRQWKVVADDFLFIETISGDVVPVAVPKNKAKTGVKVFMNQQGTWKLMGARTWVKPVSCSVTPSPTCGIFGCATPNPTGTPPTPPPTTPPTTRPPATPPAGTPTPTPNFDLVDNDETNPPTLAKTGDKGIPTGYVLGIGLLFIASGVLALLAARRFQREA